MTLDDLINLRSKANTARSAAQRAERELGAYAAIRNGDHGSMRAIEASLDRNSVRPFFEEVLMEFLPEILRVAELRKSAYAREQKAKARVIDAQIAAFLVEPEAGKEAA